MISVLRVLLTFSINFAGQSDLRTVKSQFTKPQQFLGPEKLLVHYKDTIDTNSFR